jgi:hypothetical protein
MDWIEHLLGNSIPSAVLVGLALWLFRTWISQRLTASLRVEAEGKLQALKARLDATEAEVASVRRAGIDANLQLSAVVVQERVTAIKDIWDAVSAWKAATMLSMFVSVIRAEDLDRIAGDVGTTKAVKSFLDAAGGLELVERLDGAKRWRPFVTDRAWALFAAYHGFYLGRVARAIVLTTGNKELARRLWEVNSEAALVAEAAPTDVNQAYQANVVDGTNRFLGFLEQEILVELQRSLRGEHTGADASAQAIRIVQAAQPLMQKAQELQNGDSVQVGTFLRSATIASM